MAETRKAHEAWQQPWRAAEAKEAGDRGVWHALCGGVGLLVRVWGVTKHLLIKRSDIGQLVGNLSYPQGIFTSNLGP